MHVKVPSREASPDGLFVSGLVTWTRFKFRSCWIVVILVVHIQCSKLFKGMECTVLLMVLYTTKKSCEIRVGHSPGFRLPSVAMLLQCAGSNITQYLRTHSSRDYYMDYTSCMYRLLQWINRSTLQSHGVCNGSFEDYKMDLKLFLCALHTTFNI